MISLIVAIGENNLIGKDNSLPWHYKEDLQYFKENTLNKKVLMGEQTLLSIGKPLPKRENIVATLDKSFKCDGVTIIYDLIKFLEDHKNDEEEIMIIGGKTIYKLALPYCKRLYITHVKAHHEGNVFFPEIDYSKYSKQVVRESEDKKLEFCIYTKLGDN